MLKSETPMETSLLTFEPMLKSLMMMRRSKKTRVMNLASTVLTTTGRNVAYSAFKKIENNIIDAYELLSNTEDQELFYDYLIANLKLYFDKFESELAPEVEEPTNQAYDTAKTEEEPGPEAGPEAEEELELEF